jgi:predicted nucleic acid-binding protein
MNLVDINVLAYLVIKGDHTKKTQLLYKLDSEWHTEEFVFIELTNVLTTHLRAGLLTMPVCIETFEEAENVIGSNLHNVSHLDALATAHEFRISAYDARYIALARKLGVPLITEDKQLRKAAPELTISIDEAIIRY